METLLKNPGEGLNRILDIATGTTITDAQIDKFLEFFERWVGTTIDAAGSKTLTCLNTRNCRLRTTNLCCEILLREFRFHPYLPDTSPYFFLKIYVFSGHLYSE